MYYLTLLILNIGLQEDLWVLSKYPEAQRLYACGQ